MAFARSLGSRFTAPRREGPHITWRPLRASCDAGVVTTTDRDLARWRLRSQHLVAPHAPSAEGVVRHLLAVQAENPGQAAWAVASRTRHPDADELEGLLDRGAVVRTHVLRPTWHFVAAEDIGWLLELTAARVQPVFTRQLEALGLTGTRLDRASSTVLDTLTQRPDRTRDELADSLREEGLGLSGHELVLLLGLLEMDRHVCSGRRREVGHSYAIYADRVPSSRMLDREEALAELALRYFTSHGPATERDLAYWATLTLTDVRRGTAQVADRLAPPSSTTAAPSGTLPRTRHRSNAWRRKPTCCRSSTRSTGATRTAGWCWTAKGSSRAAVRRRSAWHSWTVRSSPG